MNKKSTKNDKTFKAITEKLIDLIKSDKLNWKRGWNPGFGMPCNYESKRGYRGFNLFLTLFSCYNSSYWLTLIQVNKLGGKVKKGEKSTPIVFWKLKQIRVVEMDDESGYKVEKTKTIPILKYYNVFNEEQIEGIEFEKPDLQELGSIEDIDKAVENMPNKPQFNGGGGHAYYNPTFDFIGMPEKGSFISQEEYYSTLFHELVHSTGHTSRLNRATVMSGSFFGHHDYSFEELIAELGSCFLNAMFGINTKDVDDNSAAYLQHWLGQLKEDPSLLYKAASQAQKAVDFILGKVKTEEGSQENQVAKAA